MSLYAYTGELANGQTKSGKVTAKSDKEARDRITNEQKVVKILSCKAEDVAKPKPQSKTKPASKPASNSKPLTKLQKMLFIQGYRCFFCGDLLPESEASIEHLNPISKGGTKTEDNEVVCHVTLNQTFGNISLREKFEVVLRHQGKFRCPTAG